MLNSLAQCLRFLSRLPIPGGPTGPEGHLGLADILGWAPLAGVVIAIVPALGLALGVVVGLPPLASSLIAITLSAFVTGGLHEDGLADVADGFGGGYTPERKLEIMKDSRIGAFGALALIVSVGLRAVLLGDIVTTHGLPTTPLLVLATAAVSRATMLIPMALLQPARRDGLARSAGGLPINRLVQALLIAGVIHVLLLGLAGFSLSRTVAAFAVTLVIGLGMARLARRQIGGVTGDVIGATEQLCETALLMALCAGR